MVPSEISALSCEATASENSTWPLERTGQIWTRWHYRVCLQVTVGQSRSRDPSLKSSILLLVTGNDDSSFINLFAGQSTMLFPVLSTI
jgi:hypothetical protein